MASVTSSTSMPVNVNNGNLEKAVQSDANVQSGSVTKGSVSVENGVDPGTASRPSSGGEISYFDDPMAKKLPIGDDLFE